MFIAAAQQLFNRDGFHPRTCAWVRRVELRRLDSVAGKGIIRPVARLFTPPTRCERGIIRGAGRQVVGPSWAKSRLALFVPPGYRPKPAWGQRATKEAACPPTCGPRSHRAPTGTPVPAHHCSARLRSRGNHTPKTIG